MPRLFLGAESIPGLTRPTTTFDDTMTLDLGNRVVELRHVGRGHTAGDVVVWLPDERILFAGDLVEAQAAPYMGDAHVDEWSTTTLDNVAALGASSWSVAADPWCAATRSGRPSTIRAPSCARHWKGRAQEGARIVDGRPASSPRTTGPRPPTSC